MATPVGHYLFGLAVTQLLARDGDERNQGRWLAGLACAPDLDVVPGLLVGKMNQFHHGASHSFFAAALFSFAGLWVFRWWGGDVSSRLCLLLFFLYCSHMMLDYLCLDTGAPFGVPLLWPWSDETYLSPWLLLPDVHHSSRRIVGVHNLLLMIREVLVLLPLIGLIQILKSRSHPWFAPAAWFYGCWFLVALWLSVLSVN
jgi:inner membrane protein